MESSRIGSRDKTGALHALQSQAPGHVGCTVTSGQELLGSIPRWRDLGTLCVEFAFPLQHLAGTYITITIQSEQLKGPTAAA